MIDEIPSHSIVSPPRPQSRAATREEIQERVSHPMYLSSDKVVDLEHSTQKSYSNITDFDEMTKKAADDSISTGKLLMENALKEASGEYTHHVVSTFHSSDIAKRFMEFSQDGMRTVSEAMPETTFHPIDEYRYTVKMPLNPDAPENGTMRMRLALVPHHEDGSLREVVAEGTYTINSREYFENMLRSLDNLDEDVVHSMQRRLEGAVLSDVLYPIRVDSPPPTRHTITMNTVPRSPSLPYTSDENRNGYPTDEAFVSKALKSDDSPLLKVNLRISNLERNGEYGIKTFIENVVPDFRSLTRSDQEYCIQRSLERSLENGYQEKLWDFERPDVQKEIKAILANPNAISLLAERVKNLDSEKMDDHVAMHPLGDIDIVHYFLSNVHYAWERPRENSGQLVAGSPGG